MTRGVKIEDGALHDGLWARTGNLLLSGWLLVSAFAWERGGPPRTNAAVVAYLVFVFATVATSLDGARAVNALAALWLIASVWIVPAHSTLMRWNTALVGVGMLLLSLVSRGGDLRLPPFRRFLARLDGAHAH